MPQLKGMGLKDVVYPGNIGLKVTVKAKGESCGTVYHGRMASDRERANRVSIELD